MLKQSVNQLDLMSKRIIVIAIGISVVLLSASLLMKAATPAAANSSSNFVPAQTSNYDGRLYDAIGVSTSNSGSSIHYFLIWNTQTGTYKVTRSSDNSTRNW